MTFVLAHPKTQNRISKLLPPNIGQLHFGRAFQYEKEIEVFLRSGHRQFVVIGGDGTVFDLLNFLFLIAQKLSIPTSEIKIGAIAGGSSNDFHKSKAELPALGCARLDFENAEPVDIMSFQTDQGTFYSTMNASIGLIANANDSFNRSSWLFDFLKKVKMSLAIYLTAVKTVLFDKGLVIRLNNEICAVTTIGFSKSRFFAGSFAYPTEPQILPGYLGVYIIPRFRLLQRIHALVLLEKGAFHKIHNTRALMMTQVHLQAESTFALEINGEVFHTRNCQIQVLKGAVQLCPLNSTPK